MQQSMSMAKLQPGIQRDRDIPIKTSAAKMDIRQYP